LRITSCAILRRASLRCVFTCLCFLSSLSCLSFLSNQPLPSYPTTFISIPNHYLSSSNSFASK
jgi:hypothetical protein